MTGTASRVPSQSPHDLPTWWPRPGELQATGSNADLDVLIPLALQAVGQGLLSEAMAMWGVLGHLRGFDIGMDVEDLKGFRLFKNHPSAALAEDKISAAI